jgi:hypothetical protein
MIIGALGRIWAASAVPGTQLTHHSPSVTHRAYGLVQAVCHIV